MTLTYNFMSLFGIQYVHKEPGYTEAKDRFIYLWLLTGNGRLKWELI